MDIAAAVKAILPSAVIFRDFDVQDDSDGNGPRISAWRLDTPEPTRSEIEAAWAAIAPSLAWDEVRAARVPLLAAADLAILKAEDKGQDAKTLRTYRQALRDVTKGADPANPVWPARPW